DYDGQTVVVDPTHRSGQDPYLRVNNDKIDTKKTKHCNVGERYRLGACNYCYCNELGIRICTRHSCDNHGTELPDSEYIPKEYETECKIGVRFRLDKCNYCYCNAHRQLICSKNKCPSSNDQAPYLRSPFEEACEEGHVLAESCVICTCTANKTYVCIPEKTEDCDVPIHTNVSVMIEKDCVDGEVHSTYDGCNVCVCMNGKIACTNKGCLQVLRRLESKGVKQNTHKADVTFCKPFTFFSPDGNRFCRNCFCLHNGLALCLLNLCKEDTPHKTISKFSSDSI
ncbi:hypothetical protein HF086_011918, partial [Spodoptera exigua]